MGKICDLTPRKVAKIEILLKEGASGSEIAKKVGVSQPSVSRIRQKIAAGKGLSPRRSGKCGRRRATTTRDDSLLVRECRKNRKASSRQLQGMLEQHGVAVSSRTVRRRLLDAGLRACRPLKKQKLTKQMKKKRLKWAIEFESWTTEDWEQVKTATFVSI